MLPFTMHEQRLDRATAVALRGLQGELLRLQAAHAEDQTRIQRLEELLLEREDMEEGSDRGGRLNSTPLNTDSREPRT
jgi:hypothetical protein